MHIVLPMTPSAKLVALLRNESPGIVEGAAWALSCIATSSESAQATVQADVLDCTAGLLESTHSGVEAWTCEVLARLARHESLRDAVLGVKPCGRLVFLLRGDNPRVVESAARALSWIATSSEGAHAALDASVLHWVAALFRSPHEEVRRWTCEVIVQLAWYDSTRGAVLMRPPCTPPAMR
ncbi:armadillo-type protein [Mycena latifolia]|nr:armadillo-type protein [Mycena latifolia]